MGDTQVSEANGMNNDIHYLQSYLQCLKDEIVKNIDHLHIVNQSKLNLFVDVTDLTPIRNRAKFKKVSANTFEVKQEIEYFKEKQDEIKQVARKLEITESDGKQNNQQEKSQLNEISINFCDSIYSIINGSDFINEALDDNDCNGNNDDDDGDDAYNDDDSDGNWRNEHDSIKGKYDQLKFGKKASGKGIFKEKNEQLQYTSYYQEDCTRAHKPYDPLPNNRCITKDKITESALTSQSTFTSQSTLTPCTPVNVHKLDKSPRDCQLNKQLRQSCQKLSISGEAIDDNNYDNYNDEYDDGDTDGTWPNKNDSIIVETEQSKFGKRTDGRTIFREKNVQSQFTSCDQEGGKGANQPYDSLQNNRYISQEEITQSTLTSKSTVPPCASVNNCNLNNRSPRKCRLNKRIDKNLRQSGQRLLTSREETVKPFCVLKHELASPDPQRFKVMEIPTYQLPRIAKRTDTPYKIYDMDWENVKINNDVVICRKYNVIDRNWIDVILFKDYYLVTIQKKVPTKEAHEYLNKYDKETGVLLQWLLLPDAGTMCKINEDGFVAVLQIGGQNRCVAVVNTCRHTFHWNAHELRIIYRFSVPELYSDICCLGQLQEIEFKNELYPCFEFAAVFGAQRYGRISEEIDRLHPEITRHQVVKKNFIYSFVSRKSKIVRRNAICSIDALDTNRIVVSLNYGIACIDLCGNTLWYMPTDLRVTDICCYNNNIFACLPDNSQVLKIYIRNGEIFKQDENVIKGEHIKPSQISVSGNEILVREFIQTEYRSEVLIRVIET